MRPLQLNTEANGLLSAAAKFYRVNDDSAIRIFHVLQRAFGETAALQFLNWVVIRNFAEFIQPSGRTPSAALKPVPERDIECGTINACLPARDDLKCLHCSAGL